MKQQAVQIYSTLVKPMQQTYIIKYAIDDIASKTASDIVPIQIPFHKGELSSIRIHCNSHDYDLTLHTNSEAISPSVEEIVKITTISEEFQSNTNIIYRNTDEPVKPYLYMRLKNNDVCDTGIITMTLVFKTEWTEGNFNR